MPPFSLQGFPSAVVPARLVRVCRRGRSAWWLSSDGSRRFDLAAPDGTCYLATDRFGALREASRGGPVSSTWVSGRGVRYLAPPLAGAWLAATTAARAAQFALTKEISTIVPYRLRHAWAVAWRRHGFAGVRHELGHDPRARASGAALFGPSGAPPWPEGRGESLTGQALAAAGVAALGVPFAAELRIVP